MAFRERVPGRVDIEGDGVRQEYELAKSGEVVGKLGPGANRITITLTTGQPANEGR